VAAAIFLLAAARTDIPTYFPTVRLSQDLYVSIRYESTTVLIIRAHTKLVGRVWSGIKHGELCTLLTERVFNAIRHPSRRR